MRRMLLSIALSAVVAGWAGMGVVPANAQQSPQVLGSFNDWDTYKLDADGDTMCYAVSQPKDMAPKNVKRGDVFFIITNWSKRKVKGEPSIITGYPYREASRASAQIGGQKFEFFTQGDGAWVRDPKDEKRIVSSMRRGNSMIVKGTSARGTLTTDRYSLSGISAALDKINQACK